MFGLFGIIQLDNSGSLTFKCDLTVFNLSKEISNFDSYNYIITCILYVIYIILILRL